MKYTICELEAFSVIGQEVELTNYQKKHSNQYAILEKVQQ